MSVGRLPGSEASPAAEEGGRKVHGEGSKSIKMGILDAHTICTKALWPHAKGSNKSPGVCLPLHPVSQLNL